MGGKKEYYVHESSIVDEGAEIGAGTKIWHFSHVLKGAKIGSNCGIGQGCCIAGAAVIGDNVRLQNGISVYDAVTIEDDAFCGPHMVFTNVLNPRSFISRKHEYLPTRLCKGCSVGAGSVIICGNTVGRYAMVGSGSVVTKDIKPFALVYGNPARQHGWVGICGTKLHFDENNLAVGEDGRRYVLKNDEVFPEDEI